MLGIVKTFGVSEKYALYDISFTNALMYSRTVPIPGDGKAESENAPLFDNAKDACDPDNFRNEFADEDEIIIRKQ